MKIPSRVETVVALLALGGAPSLAGATVIDVTSENLSGNTYRYDFSLENDTLAQGIEEVSVFFDLLLYDNLRDAVAPSGWDPLVVQSDPILAADGFVDLLALFAPVALGETLEFSVTFDFLGATRPGDLLFQVLDPFTFEVIDEGTTRMATAVPAPSSMALLGLAAGLVFARGRRRGGGFWTAS